MKKMKGKLQLKQERKLAREMSPKFFPKVGSMEITSWYADNKVYCKELMLCLSVNDWNELEGEPFYQELMKFLKNKGILKG